MSTSSYEIRVNEVVEVVAQMHLTDPLVGQDSIRLAIANAAKNVTDYKMGGRTQKEFVTDVMAGLKGKLKKPKTEKAA